MSRRSRLAALVVLCLGELACGGQGEDQVVVDDYARTTLGSYHRYRTHADVLDTAVVTAATPEGYTRRVHTGSGAAYDETDFAVIDGALYITRSRRYHSTGTLASESAYDPPALFVPADVTPGASGTTTSVVTVMTGSTTMTYTSQRDVTVVGEEPITVPAGTFRALKVEALVTTTTSSTSTQRGLNTVWWVPGVGRVRSQNSVLGTGAVTSWWDLQSRGSGAPPPVRPDGRYDVTAIACAGAPASGPLLDLIAGSNSLRLSLVGGSAEIQWGDGTCTITEPLRASYPGMGHLQVVPAGQFACAPSAAACAGLSTALFGGNACGAADASGPKDYLFNFSTTVTGGVTLERSGGQECADVGAIDPVGYTLTPQP